MSDPAVCTKLKAGMEQHAQKINYALGSWALHSSDQSGALKTAFDLILRSKRGREPSMYSDLRSDPVGTTAVAVIAYDFGNMSAGHKKIVKIGYQVQ